MNTWFGRSQTGRLLSTFTILATLTAGILIGSVVAHGVKGKEQVSSSDATPLKVPNPQVLSNTFSTIAKQIEPAVVNINTESLPKENPNRRRGRQAMPNSPDDQDNGEGEDNGGGNGDNSMQDFFNRFFGGQMPDGGGADQGPRESLGSGFIVDSKGYILTNNHVVDKADRITVKLAGDPEGDPGRPAKVVGVDKSTDIAVLKIDTKEPLPTIKLGNSDSMQVGDWVLAVGSPFGLQETVTAGIVSSKNRDIGAGPTSQFQRFIQTDAAINPGNSGGSAGEHERRSHRHQHGHLHPVHGLSGRRLCHAVQHRGGCLQPAHRAQPQGHARVDRHCLPADHVQRHGAPVYGFKNGVLVSSVDPNGPAEKAGLRAGDVITTIDGRSIKDGDDLVADISARHPGTSVKIGYLRNGKLESTVLVVGDREKGLAARTNAGPSNDNSNSDQDENASATKLGITVRNLPQGLATRMGIKGGVQIMSVKPGTFAEEIGLAQGTVITEINHKPVTNDQDFKSIVNGLKSGDDVAFVLRNPQDRQNGSNFIGGTLP
jgi:serine protease Do